MTTFYFHGVPGSGHELSLFGQDPPTDWQVVDRSQNVNLSAFNSWLDEFAGTVDAAAKSGSVRLVGFSIGAFIALQIASRVSAKDVTVDLISPAGPLQACDDRQSLAGASVFRLAERAPRLFSIMVSAQSFAARIWPGGLVAALFRSAKGNDVGLAKEPTFRATMTKNLSIGLGKSPRAYRTEILAYVDDWRLALDEVSSVVRIWHGSADNWATPQMGECLGARLKNSAGVSTLPGRSHYSTLEWFLGQ